MSASTERVAGSGRWRGARIAAGQPLPAWPSGVPLPGSAGAHPRLALLAGVVEREVIPRLVLAHGARPAHVPPPAAPRVFEAGEVGEFARLVLTRDAAVACSHVEALRARGATLEALYLNLLAPSARWLGELWEQDSADFTEVTVGLLRLLQVLYEVGPAFRDEAEARPHGWRALLLPAPGDQHTFGLAMVSDFFRRAGWAVSNPSAASTADLARLVRRERFALVGFSVSCERWLDVLTSAIRAIRGASCNPAIAIMVGGPLFVAHPELVALVGADSTAADGCDAVLQAQNLVVHLAEQGR